MDFQVAGLASGFDWKSMVDQLVAIERIPQNRLTAEKRENSDKITALNTLETKLSTLRTNLQSFKESSLYNSKSTELSNEDLGISATASTSSIEGNYLFNVTQLASASKRLGTADAGGDMGTAATVLSNLRLKTDITEGDFTINGSAITVATTDTLQDVFDNISTATGGDVTGSYDAVTDTITLNSSTGQLELGTSSDDSNFLSVMKLDQLEIEDAGGGAVSVTSTKALGVVDIDSTIASSGVGGGSPITGTGTFQINGVSIDFDADVDSMAALMSRVNSSAADVTMTYDTAADQFRFTNNKTGEYDMHVTDSGNGLLNAIGLDSNLVLGDDLQYTVDGGALQTARGNSITADDHGITGLTVKAAETGSQTITVAQNSDELRDKISTFVQNYNDVQDYILEKTKIEVADDEVTTAILADNREISALDSSLRSLAFTQITGMSGDIFRLEHLGIDFITETSKLETKNADDLEAALTGDLDTLETFFNGGTDSFADRMITFIDNFTATDGILDSQTDLLTDQNTRIDSTIEAMERRVEFNKQAMEASFIAMEQAQANINQQSSALTGLINSL